MPPKLKMKQTQQRDEVPDVHVFRRRIDAEIDDLP